MFQSIPSIPQSPHAIFPIVFVFDMCTCVYTAEANQRKLANPPHTLVDKQHTNTPLRQYQHLPPNQKPRSADYMDPDWLVLHTEARLVCVSGTSESQEPCWIIKAEYEND